MDMDLGLTDGAHRGWSGSVPTGVKVARGPVIMLQSGAELDLLDPASSLFTIDDIAHGLAHICRYAGQCHSFYSVAEHSVLVSDLAGDDAFAALLHDAAEAFLGDVTRPLKQLLPEYKRIERGVERAILDRFGIAVMPAAIKAIDLSVLAAEQAQVMPDGTNAWAEAGGVVPASIHVRCLSPEAAKKEFLERFQALRN